jgi:hypothetical protein
MVLLPPSPEVTGQPHLYLRNRYAATKAVNGATSTSPNEPTRVFTTSAETSVEFKKTEMYYLTIVEKGTTNVIDRVEFTIDIAFVNDFDF